MKKSAGVGNTGPPLRLQPQENCEELVTEGRGKCELDVSPARRGRLASCQAGPPSRSGGLPSRREATSSSADHCGADRKVLADSRLQPRLFQEHNPAMVELLLEHGADPTIQGWMQPSALDRAREWNAEGADPELQRVFNLLDEQAKCQKASEVIPFSGLARNSGRMPRPRPRKLKSCCCPSAALQRGFGSEAGVLVRTGWDENSCENEAMWGNRTT